MVVVTVPDPRTSTQIIRMIRRLRPQVPIAVRCRHNRHMSDLREAGADIVVDEETTMGEVLSREIVII